MSAPNSAGPATPPMVRPRTVPAGARDNSHAAHRGHGGRRRALPGPGHCSSGEAGSTLFRADAGRVLCKLYGAWPAGLPCLTTTPVYGAWDARGTRRKRTKSAPAPSRARRMGRSLAVCRRSGARRSARGRRGLSRTLGTWNERSNDWEAILWPAGSGDFLLGMRAKTPETP